MSIPPPPILMRELARGDTMFSIHYPLSHELMNKIDQNCKLSVMYSSHSRMCIGHYDKNNMCMMLNGTTSLTFYVCGTQIMITNCENGHWVHHVISEQQPLEGSRIINTDTNEETTIRIEHGMVIM